MRLLESEHYRGREIRIYVVYPDEAGAPATQQVPMLGVQIDGLLLGQEMVPPIFHLPDALAWAKGRIDQTDRQSA